MRFMTNSGADVVEQTKRCCTCKQTLSVAVFHKLKSSKDGLAHRCKVCAAQARKEWYEANKEAQSVKAKAWSAANRDVVRRLAKEWRERNRDAINEYRRAWRKRTGYDVAWMRDKAQKDPVFRLNRKLAKNIHDSILCENARGKKLRTIVGYGIKELRTHLEAKFKDGMTWDNYGSYWHIDHIVPKSWFKYGSVEDEAFKKCWGLDNLQPLKAIDNISKGNRYAG